MILTDSSKDVPSEEQFSALETLYRSEGRAWLGRDLRQVVIGDRLASCHEPCSRVVPSEEVFGT